MTKMKRSIRGILRRHASGTTMHGLPQVIQAESLKGRVFWSFTCLLSIFMFLTQFSQLLIKYYSYPKKVNIDVVRAPVPFPAISICNQRSLDIMVMKRLDKIFLEIGNWKNEEYSARLARIQDPFTRDYFKAVLKYIKPFDTDNPFGYNLTMVLTMISRDSLATHLERHLLEEASVSLEELIVLCTYANRKCDLSQDIVRFFDPYYYNCYTYKPQQNDKKPLFEGAKNGWSAVVLVGGGMLPVREEFKLLPGAHDSFSPLSGSEGIRVVIHDPDTVPYPQSEGYDVPPGFSASFAVRAKENVRVGLPHGNCSTEDGTRKYQALTREKECVQDAIVNACKCTDINLPTFHMSDEVMFCTNDSSVSDSCGFNTTRECALATEEVYARIKCSKKVREEVSQDSTLLERCNCFPECHSITYDATYSLASYPARGYEGDGAIGDILIQAPFYNAFNISDPGRYKFYKEYFELPKRANFAKDFARINVYITDSNVMRVVESVDYTSSQFLSDIGGQLGLWIGVSIITLSELLKLLVELVMHLMCYKRTRSRKRKKLRAEKSSQETEEMPTVVTE